MQLSSLSRYRDWEVSFQGTGEWAVRRGEM